MCANKQKDVGRQVVAFCPDNDMQYPLKWRKCFLKYAHRLPGTPLQGVFWYRPLWGGAAHPSPPPPPPLRRQKGVHHQVQATHTHMLHRPPQCIGLSAVQPLPSPVQSTGTPPPPPPRKMVRRWCRRRQHNTRRTCRSQNACREKSTAPGAFRNKGPWEPFEEGPSMCGRGGDIIITERTCVMAPAYLHDLPGDQTPARVQLQCPPPPPPQARACSAAQTRRCSAGTTETRREAAAEPEGRPPHAPEHRTAKPPPPPPPEEACAIACAHKRRSAQKAQEDSGSSVA